MQKRLYNHEPQHCVACQQKKLICKGGGPGEGSCKSCSKRGYECAWVITAEDAGEIEKPCRDQSSDDGEDQNPEKKFRQTDEVTSSKSLFPCPYFLRDPSRPRRNPSCSGPGWEKFHRLTEHLNRAHKLPVHCMRCFLIFRSTNELKEHLLRSSEDMCNVINHPPLPHEGFSEDQEKAFKNRKGANQTDDERWRTLWHILFPGDSEGDVRDRYEYSSLGNTANIYRHVERLRLIPRRMMGKLEQLACQPPNSITVEDIQEGIRKMLQEAQPELSYISLLPQQPPQGSTPINSASSSKNPFHRAKNPAASPSQPTAGFTTQTVNGVAIPPSIVSHNSEPTETENWNHERPSDVWFREKQARRAAPLTAVSSSIPTPPSQYGNSNPSTLPAQNMQLMEIWQPIPIRSHQWIGDQQPTASPPIDSYIPNHINSTTPMPSFLPVTQSQTTYPEGGDLRVQNQLDFTTYVWPSTSNPYNDANF